MSINIGYYDLSAGQGNANEIAPITAAGNTAINITIPNAAQLAGIKILFVTNPSNGDFGAEYIANLPAIQAAVAAGMVLVIHDRYVTNAGSILPGGAGIATPTIATPMVV